MSLCTVGVTGCVSGWCNFFWECEWVWKRWRWEKFKTPTALIYFIFKYSSNFCCCNLTRQTFVQTLVQKCLYWVFGVLQYCSAVGFLPSRVYEKLWDCIRFCLKQGVGYWWSRNRVITEHFSERRAKCCCSNSLTYCSTVCCLVTGKA